MSTPKTAHRFEDPKVKAAFAAYPQGLREKLLGLRALVLEAAKDADCGPLEESLKWGQPAARPKAPNSGATVRLDAMKAGGCALYVNCQTTLAAEFRDLHPGRFRDEGDRPLLFVADETPPPRDERKHCVALALSYHKR
jgi:hypothetical protein